ncbi:MAG TPA: hypothetical protein VJ436_03305 [Anaerolineales bacterium]|nr:hypothetical protein [Anaerolineales bacterium]
MKSPPAFLPGHLAAHPGLMARYLPPLPAGVASAWLGERVPPGSWVIDPFGASPAASVEMARAGYRLLVTANNPIARFLLDLAAQPPGESALRAALAELAMARKGDERLEPHLRGLYLTSCEQCGGEVEAEAFLWEKEAQEPYGRLYQCPHCGDAGERPATRQDRQNAQRFSAGGLHRARALERIALRDDPDRPHAEEALSTYLPRAIYALTTLINKMDSFASVPAGGRQRELYALLLYALDQANNLWPHPVARPRPRQLSAHRRFRENNIWLALEQAVDNLASQQPAVKLTTWPELLPETGGLVIFEGRLKDLSNMDQNQPGAVPEFRATVGALPRPNQAFWTLSALWAGWLWGREAIGPFKSVLRRRRYDWTWHATALHAGLSHLSPLLPAETPFLGLVAEAEPGFLGAALVAADQAGFSLEGLALRSDSAQAQISWRRTAGLKIKAASSPERLYNLAAGAAFDHLRLRGEPASYLPLYVAGLSTLLEAAGVSSKEGGPPNEPQAIAESFESLQTILEQSISPFRGFHRYGGGEKSPEAGLWWLADEPRPQIPLGDQVEMAVVRTLHKFPGCMLSEIDAAVCAALPGLLTPDSDLVTACLESYGEQAPPGGGRWQLRPADVSQARRADLTSIRAALEALGSRLGYTIQGQKPSLWLDEEGQAAYVFYLLASTTFGELVFTNPYPAGKSLIVLPGARANLAVFKQRRDPRLRQVLETGWRFLKFRHLRHLSESPSLTRDNLDEQLPLDPLTDAPEQMRLL